MGKLLQEQHGFEQLVITERVDPSTGLRETNTEELLGHVSVNWQKDFVIYPVSTLKEVESLKKKPFFLLVAVDAPTSVRFKRDTSKRQTVFSFPTMALWFRAHFRACFFPNHLVDQLRLHHWRIL